MKRALWCVLACITLVEIAFATDPVGICGLDGFDLTDLYFGQYWNFTVENPQENCLHEINDTDIASCTVYFSVCKPLPKNICGEANVSYCEVVTATNGTQYQYTIGRYTTKHNFIALSSGFSAIRTGEIYKNERECNDFTFVTTANFECDSGAKFNTSDPSITKYITSVERIPSSPCYNVFSIKYAGACYRQPTLAPSDCSLTGFDTTALSEKEYFYATLPTEVCYDIDGDDCMMIFAFCHPLPLDISKNCSNPESAVCQADKLKDATTSLSMGAFENYTRFYENVDTNQVGFHVMYSQGSNPGDPDCTGGLATRIVFVCNEDATWTEDDITFNIEIERDPCFYNIIAQYDGACYKAHDIDGGSSHEKTSYIGWIFIGIFLFGILTYLTVGSAIQYFVRGERGIRVLPNFDFWRNVILLSIGGCKFCLDTITCHRFDGVPRKGKVYDQL